MTHNEKLIWAAVFAKNLDFTLQDDVKEVVATATADASVVVGLIRKHKDFVIEYLDSMTKGGLNDVDATAMFLEMMEE
jgi:hypothetical protein